MQLKFLLLLVCFAFVPEISAGKKESFFPADLSSKWAFSIKEKKLNKVRFSAEGFKNDSAMVLCNGKAGWNIYAALRNGFAVKEGDIISIRAMVRGSGRIGLFTSFKDASGKAVAVKDKSIVRRKYQFVTKDWKELFLKSRIPAGVTKFSLSIRSIGDKGEIFVSSLKVDIESGLILKNEKMRAVFNPVTGGLIDSLTLPGIDFDLTYKNLGRKAGGLFRDLVPGNEMPGVFSREYYSSKVLTPGSRILFTRVNPSGNLKGLKLEKEFFLVPHSGKLDVTVTLTNTGKQTLKTSYRVHNIISNGKGTFSWPLNDWVQTFLYDSRDPYGIYKITASPLRAGWFARTYESIGKTLLFQFSLPDAEKGFSYLTKELNTLELYCREFTLAPAEKRVYKFSLSMIDSGRTRYYCDPYGKKQREQKIVLKKLPKVPVKQNILPEKYRDHFPFVVRLGHPVRGVRSGGGPMGRWTRDLIFENTKSAINNYCNGVYSWNIGGFSKINDKNGKNIYGELLRRLDATYSEVHHICKKTDIEITPEFIKSVPDRMKKFQDKDVRKFMKEYHDRFLCVYSADEIAAQNVEAMLYLHNEAAKLLPKDVLIFPYLMITGEPLIPYLPVFLLDSYPIHKDVHGGRDPWRIYPTFKRIVKTAGKDRPVWFMPQGFGGGGYVMPNDAEMKLMLNLAVAAGVRGVIFYGLLNHNWPWVFSGYDAISCFGGAGQYTSCWEAIGSVAKQLGAVGSLLARSAPAAVPAGVRIRTRDFNADKFNTVKQLYRGPAVTLNALALDCGTILSLVNNNIYETERTELLYGKNKLLDIKEMKTLAGGTCKITLPPGEARYFFMGKIASARKEIYKGMFLRERARYRLFLDQALLNGVRHKEPDFSKYAPEKAYRELLKDFSLLRKKTAILPLGRALSLMEKTQKALNTVDELFVNNMDIVVSKAMSKHKYYPPHEDPEVERSRSAVYKAFFRWNHFNLAIAEGRAEKILPELEKFAAKTASDCNAACEMIRKRQQNKK